MTMKHWACCNHVILSRLSGTKSIHTKDQAWQKLSATYKLHFKYQEYQKQDAQYSTSHYNKVWYSTLNKGTTASTNAIFFIT